MLVLVEVPSACSSKIRRVLKQLAAPKAPAPLLWRRPEAASISVDGEIRGSMNGTIYPTASGPTNGAEIHIILPEGLLNSSGRIVAQLRVHVEITEPRLVFEHPSSPWLLAFASNEF